MDLFDNLPNIQLITRYYRWFAIKADADDDKFVDCAVAANAICIITEDKHFKVLEQLDFPKIKAMTIDEFKGLYQK